MCNFNATLNKKKSIFKKGRRMPIAHRQPMSEAKQSVTLKSFLGSCNEIHVKKTNAPAISARRAMKGSPINLVDIVTSSFQAGADCSAKQVCGLARGERCSNKDPDTSGSRPVQLHDGVENSHFSIYFAFPGRFIRPMNPSCHARSDVKCTS
jgi:hypothetical protein